MEMTLRFVLGDSWKQRLLLLTLASILLLTASIVTAAGVVNDHSIADSRELHSLHRKLLGGDSRMKKINRIWGDKCTTTDIVISQGITRPLPNGVPTYSVEIINVCVTGCEISNIHLYCGWFSSTHLVNPKIFRRLHFNDCIVNDGKPLVNGDTLSFEYANTYLYPLSVSSVSC